MSFLPKNSVCFKFPLKKSLKGIEIEKGSIPPGVAMVAASSYEELAEQSFRK